MKGREFNVDAGDRSRVRTESFVRMTTSLCRCLAPLTCELATNSVEETLLMPRSQNFNEIMPAIYARFMEKEARQWRQIYKVSSRLTTASFDTEEA